MNHDEWYNRWSESTVSNACVVRVTNRCNQKCIHCVFRSGPDCVGQMSIKMCEKINAWVPRKVVLNIMGGEVTVLQNYPEVLAALAKNRSCIRLVTNGFWSRNSNKFFDAIKQIEEASCHQIDVAVSQDYWHDEPSHHAILLLKKHYFKNDCPVNLVEPGGIHVFELSPIGRAWDNNILPKNIIKCQCEAMSNMIITEDGMIGRCPYGYFPWKHFTETTWHDAQEYVWGWRSEKLAEGMNCNLCMETVQCGIESNKTPVYGEQINV